MMKQGIPCEVLRYDMNDVLSIIITCANCGKEDSDVTNTCNKCKMVMYCNAACKKEGFSERRVVP